LEKDQSQIVRYFQLLRGPAQCLTSLAAHLQTHPVASVKHVFKTQLSDLSLSFPVMLEGGMQALQLPEASSKEMMDQVITFYTKIEQLCNEVIDIQNMRSFSVDDHSCYSVDIK
jgi:hypothetical protein